jgi:hypothetical protein
VTGIVAQRSERDLSHAAATAAGHGRRRSRRRFEAVVSPTSTRMPAPRSCPELSCSTRRWSNMAEEVVRSSTKTSANSAPRAMASPSVRAKTSCSTRVLFMHASVPESMADATSLVGALGRLAR